MPKPPNRLVVADVLNLLDLAKGEAAKSLPALGAVLEQLSTPSPRQAHAGHWYVVLMGELIIDLPHGDFRILRSNDLLTFEETIDITLTPVDDVTFLHGGSR